VNAPLQNKYAAACLSAPQAVEATRHTAFIVHTHQARRGDNLVMQLKKRYVRLAKKKTFQHGLWWAFMVGRDGAASVYSNDSTIIIMCVLYTSQFVTKALLIYSNKMMLKKAITCFVDSHSRAPLASGMQWQSP
jgi:hypothetical protein